MRIACVTNIYQISFLTINYNIFTIYFMNEINSSWDDQKKSNQSKKYGVAFEKTQSVFLITMPSNIMILATQNLKIGS